MNYASTYDETGRRRTRVGEARPTVRGRLRLRAERLFLLAQVAKRPAFPQRGLACLAESGRVEVGGHVQRRAVLEMRRTVAKGDLCHLID